MKISAYLFSVAAKNLLYPYEASIKSILPLVDEVWIAIDPEFEEATIYTGLSDKVKIVEHKYDVLNWDIRNQMWQAARSECTGDWCMFWHLGGVLPLQYVDTIKNMLEVAYPCDEYNSVLINTAYIGYDDWIQLCRPSAIYFTRNFRYLQHQTPQTAIGYFDSAVYEGKYLLTGSDDATLIDIRSDTWMGQLHKPYRIPDVISINSAKDVMYSLEMYSCVFYYTWYSMLRKNAQGSVERGYMDRLYGRSTILDADEYYMKLKQPLHLVGEEEKLYDWWPDKYKIDIQHPEYIHTWLELINER